MFSAKVQMILWTPTVHTWKNGAGSSFRAGADQAATY